MRCLRDTRPDVLIGVTEADRFPATREPFLHEGGTAGEEHGIELS